MIEKSNFASGDQAVKKFGRGVADIFDRTLRQVQDRITNSKGNPHDHFEEYLATLEDKDRLLLVAQDALEAFIHDFMFFIESSEDFKIVTSLSDETTVDLKEFCPEGLHGQQLDWLEEYGNHENVHAKLWRLYPGPNNPNNFG